MSANHEAERKHLLLLLHSPQPVDLKVFIQDFEFKKYCNSELRTGNFTPTARAPGGWDQFTIPFVDFRCDYQGASPADVSVLYCPVVAECRSACQLPVLHHNRAEHALLYSRAVLP